MTEDIELSPGEVRERVKEPSPEPWRENLSRHLVCPDCQEDPPNLMEEFSSGDLVCGSCGNVLQANIVDNRSEWRSFANDDQGNDDPSRVGDAINPLFDGPGLVSTIQFDRNSKLAKGLSLAQSKIAMEEKGSKQLLESFTRIDNICSAKEWPKVIGDTAKQLYKKTLESKTFRAKGQDAVIAGCIFLACRQNDQPRTFKEITSLTQVNKKEVGRIFKQLEKYFKMMKNDSKHGGYEINGYKQTNATEPHALCDRFGHLLGLPIPVSIMAGDCTKLLIDTALLAGRSPLSIAAVGLYAISNFMDHPKSAKEVGKACGVSDGTIKTAWKKIYDQRMKVIKPEWIERGGDVSRLPSA